MNIVFHIERLILDGVATSRADGRRVERALEAELSRLIAAGGLGSEIEAGRAPEPRLGAVEIAPHQSPDTLGRSVAHSLYSGLTELSSASSAPSRGGRP
jgi:hypothetical protein